MIESEEFDPDYNILKVKGKPITCKICEHEFKVLPVNRGQWEADKMVCPSCGCEYCCLPNTERLLRIEQNKYLESKDFQFLQNIYKIAYPYIKSLILQKNFNAINSDKELLYHTHSLTTLLVEEYLKDPDFKIEVSFGNFINRKLPQSIYGKQEYTVEGQREVGNLIVALYCNECGYSKKVTQKKKEKKPVTPTSLLSKKCPTCNNTLIEQKKIFTVVSVSGGGDEVDQMHNLSKDIDCNKDITKLKKSFVLRNRLIEILVGVDDYCDDKKDNFHRLLGIRNFFKFGQKNVSRLFNQNKRIGKASYMDTLKLINLEIGGSGIQEEEKKEGEIFNGVKSFNSKQKAGGLF